MLLVDRTTQYRADADLGGTMQRMGTTAKRMGTTAKRMRTTAKRMRTTAKRMRTTATAASRDLAHPAKFTSSPLNTLVSARRALLHAVVPRSQWRAEWFQRIERARGHDVPVIIA
jgi:hypothetical protein